MLTLQARMPAFVPGTHSRRKDADPPTPSCVLSFFEYVVARTHRDTCPYLHIHTSLTHIFKKNANSGNLKPT